MPGYVWKKADIHDAESFFELIKKRIVWMDSVGIKHWNALDYTEVYPLRHFIENAECGRLWVLKENERVLGGAVLYETDEYWADDPCDTAYYVHRLAADTDEKGIGREILKRIYETAVKNGKTCLRLDCSEDNPKLNAYYESAGYMPNGSCVDGPYTGIRRELKIK